MAYVPSGSFKMGSDQATVAWAYELCAEDNDTCDRSQYESEEPIQEVTVGSFWIDRTEVTNAQYAAFLNEQGNRAEGGVNWLDLGDDCLIEHVDGKYTPKAGFAGHPAVCVSWYGATAYAEWVGGRLPTEAEWEYAARGPGSSIYPWGSEIAVSAPQANFCDRTCEYDWALEGIDDGYAQTASVGSYPGGASWIGALNMGGNVWEWTASPFRHYETGEDLGDKDARTIRGGSFTNLRANVRGAYRGASAPTDRVHNLGFRVVIPGDQIPHP
jgi:formylglycine-generating enzyme required for sulfatase activity